MSRFVRLLLASALGLSSAITTANAGPSAASEATIAVAPLQIDGELSEEAVAKLEQQLLAGLERGGVGVVPPADVQVGDASLPCGDSVGCIVKLAKANGASHVLQVRITKSGRDYALEMVLSSGGDGSTQAKTQQDCEICGLQELGGLIGDQAAALQPKLEAVPGTLIVESSPSGATVKVDGKLVGVTPIVEPVSEGEHIITIAKPGYLERERKVTVVAGSEENLSIGLQPVPAPVVEEPKGPDGTVMRSVGWASLGVGLAAAGTGVALVLIDEQPVSGRCTPENIDANGVCRFRHNTLGSGIGLLAGGGAALVAGAVLVGLGYKRKKQAGGGTTARVLPTGTGLIIRF